MSEILQWVLIFIAIAIPPVIVALINYFAYKRKVRAEAENIETKTKIAKEITYDQLKTENKQKEIKGKIEILTSLTRLEEEIKNKKSQTASDQKKLAALETLKKEFKETLAESKTTLSTKPLLVKKEDKNQKKKNKRSKKS
ncbi:MAG: hypothetical protein I3273_00425 [Candidatus Moeniiplasma glomeromycotorum]|nr:hypothetical protein [Candidatus Moeniiplasma glomeromycotorum]MCE8167409.1 hypothetical protein [Candidatus Moeniiplasma glomeromycotorum]MCE8168577.1 hypothetical protein [Candidatus Moeniiplasma glomeromycotorum]